MTLLFETGKQLIAVGLKLLDKLIAYGRRHRDLRHKTELLSAARQELLKPMPNLLLVEALCFQMEGSFIAKQESYLQLREWLATLREESRKRARRAKKKATRRRKTKTRAARPGRRKKATKRLQKTHPLSPKFLDLHRPFPPGC